jgi:hypothetical protein
LGDRPAKDVMMSGAKRRGNRFRGKKLRDLVRKNPWNARPAPPIRDLIASTALLTSSEEDDPGHEESEEEGRTPMERASRTAASTAK